MAIVNRNNQLQSYGVNQVVLYAAQAGAQNIIGFVRRMHIQDHLLVATVSGVAYKIIVAASKKAKGGWLAFGGIGFTIWYKLRAWRMLLAGLTRSLEEMRALSGQLEVNNQAFAANLILQEQAAQMRNKEHDAQIQQYAENNVQLAGNNAQLTALLEEKQKMEQAVAEKWRMTHEEFVVISKDLQENLKENAIQIEALRQENSRLERNNARFEENLTRQEQAGFQEVKRQLGVVMGKLQRRDNVHKELETLFRRIEEIHLQHHAGENV